MGIFDMMMGGGFGGGFRGGFGGGGVVPHFDPIGDAVKEIVADGIKDALDPSRKERRQEADRCNDEARRAIDEAEELRSNDLVRLQSRSDDLASELRQQAETLADLKTRISRDIELEFTPKIQRFQSLDIQNRVGRAPRMATASPSLALPALRSLTACHSFGGCGSGLSILDLLSDDTEGDLDIAQENLSRARTFRAEVRKAVAELRTQVSGMESTLASLKSEESTLRELHRRMKMHMDALSTAEGEDSFTQQEADAYQRICEISEMIRDSLRVQICKSDGSTAKGYARYLAELERVAASVPEKPALRRPSRRPRIPWISW